MPGEKNDIYVAHMKLTAKGLLHSEVVQVVAIQLLDGDSCLLMPPAAS